MIYATMQRYDYIRIIKISHGQYIVKNTSYKKVIAIGVSGNEKVHRITAEKTA